MDTAPVADVVATLVAMVAGETVYPIVNKEDVFVRIRPGYTLAAENRYYGRALGQKSVSELTSIVFDAGNSFDRTFALLDLARIGPDAKTAIPVLLQVLQETDRFEPSHRGLAAEALVTLGPEARDAIPALIAALEDSDSDVRFRVAFALGSIGSDAIPSLELTLHAATFRAQLSAVRALEWIYSERAWSAIKRYWLAMKAVPYPYPNDKELAFIVGRPHRDGPNATR